jgi:hypothetical protein
MLLARLDYRRQVACHRPTVTVSLSVFLSFFAQHTDDTVLAQSCDKVESG